MNIGKHTPILILPVFLFIYYFSSVDNFFAWDDFLWLYRAKSLEGDLSQMFKPEGYFDPLIYLVFWANYKIFGTNSMAYHIFDILIHGVNGIFVFYIIREITRDRRLAITASLFFLSSFSVSTVIMWTSARTDLFSTFFCLSSLFLYLQFIKHGHSKFYIFSILSFLLALSSKGTAVVLPFIIYISYKMVKKNVEKNYNILPFFLLSAAYFLILFFTSTTPSVENSSMILIKCYNLLLSLTALFIPQSILLSFKPLIYIVPAIILLTTCLFRSDLLLFCFLFMLIGILPVMNFSSELTLVDWGMPSYLLLKTPSHRIYLASVGSASFLAVVLWGLKNKIPGEFKKIFIPATVSLILIFNYKHVQSFERIWDAASSLDRNLLQQMQSKVKTVPDQATIILFSRKPISPAFARPMLKVFYNREHLNYLAMPYMPEKLPNNPAEVNTGMPVNVFAFAFSIEDGTLYDVSRIYYEAMTVAFKYKFARTPQDLTTYRIKYQKYASMINGIIVGED